MFVRTPLALVVLLALAVCAVALPGSSSGLLLLTPALAVLLPLLAGTYPGVKSVARLASWFAKLRTPERRRPSSNPLRAGSLAFLCAGFSGANGSRGPPLPSLN